MEVTIPVSADAHHDLAEDMTAMTVQDLPTETTNPSQAVTESEALPPHRSHDPQNNQKRVDPFQFGQRFLEKGDDVYEFNAWDHCAPDAEYMEYAEIQIAKQREAPVSEFDKSKFLFVSSLSICIMMIQKCIVHLNIHERNKFSNVFRSYLTCKPFNLSLFRTFEELQ